MKKPKLLFVDDETNILDDLEEIFGYLGKYEFLSAESGKKALEILKSHKIDLVLTDINMPEMDGLELASQIHKFYPRVKIIFITAFKDLIEHAVRIDPEDIIEKPIRQDIFLYKVEKHFQNISQIKIGRFTAIVGGIFATLNGIATALAIITKSSLPSKIIIGVAVLALAFFVFTWIKLRKS